MTNLKNLCIKNLIDNLPPLLQEEIIREAKKSITENIKKEFLKEMRETCAIIVTDRLDEIIRARQQNQVISYTKLDGLKYQDQDIGNTINNISVDIFDHILSTYGWVLFGAIRTNTNDMDESNSDIDEDSE